MPTLKPVTPLAFRTKGPQCEVISAPGYAEEGPWTVLVQAHGHSQECAETTLQAVQRHMPLERSLPPTQAVIAVFNSDTETLQVVTSPSHGAHLYYTQEGNTWVYSTHLPTLLRQLPRKRALDESGLLAYALLTPIEGPPFRGIEALGMGDRLIQRRGNVPFTSKWFEVDHYPPPGSVEQWVEQYCALLDEVMAVELPEHGDVSALMSAGLDSTMVVGTAAGVLGPNRSITALCLDPFPPLDGDGNSGAWLYTDLPDAIAMQDMWPQVTVVGLRNKDMLTPLDVLPTIFDLGGMPMLNPSNTVWIHQAILDTAQRGEDLLLTGQSGNLNFSWQPPDALFHLLARGQIGPAVDALRIRSQDTGRPMWSELARVVAGPPRRWLASHRRDRLSDDDVRAEAVSSTAFPMIRPDVMDRLGLWQRLDETPFSPRRQTADTWVPGNPMSGTQFFGTGMDPRVRLSDPLSAEPLVRLVAALPEEAFVGVGPNRSFARRTMKGRVPDPIRMRTNRGKQSADADQWMMHHPDAPQRLRELASDSAVASLIDTDRWLARTPTPTQPRTLGFDRTLGVALYAAWYSRWTPDESRTPPPAGSNDGTRTSRT